MDDFPPDDRFGPLDMNEIAGTTTATDSAPPEDAAERIEKARALVKECGPIAGTPAALYLSSRGIEVVGLPKGVVGWHGKSGAILFVAKDGSGEVQAVQRVYLTPEGTKADRKPVKQTNGVLKGSAMALPGTGGEVLCCEGPEDALSLWQATGQPVRCAFGISALGEVPLPAGAVAVLVADNDPHDSPTHAAIGKAINRLVVRGLVKLARPPVGVKDSNDLLREQGAEAVKTMVAAAVAMDPPEPPPAEEGKADAWPLPQPISAHIAPEPYPLDALPSIIRAAVGEVQGFVKAPLAMVACSALSALSVAGMSYVDVARAKRLSGPTGLYLLTIAESGERKSTCDGFFLPTIREWETKQAEAMKPEIEMHKAAIGTWEAKRSGLLEKIKADTKTGKCTTGTEADLYDLEHNKPEAPRVPKLLRGDDTPENLAWVMAREWPAAGVISSEAGLVLGAHGMGSDSVMRNLGLLNVLWDGGDLSVGRRSSESFTVKGARLTIALQIQEAPFLKFMERVGDVARGSGFLARFLVSRPESTQGTRFYSEPPDSWPALGAFNHRIATILDTPAPIGEDGALTPAMLELSPAAKAAWVEFYNAIEGELAAGGDLDAIRDVASKSADNVARLAALFSVFDNGGLGLVSEDHLINASAIVAWHLHETRRFFGELALSPELAAATALDKWLIEYCQREGLQTVPTKTVFQFGPSRLRKKEALDSAIAILADHDRAKLVRDGSKKSIAVNPVLICGRVS